MNRTADQYARQVKSNLRSADWVGQTESEYCLSDQFEVRKALKFVQIWFRDCV